jgi:alanine racemase
VYLIKNICEIISGSFVQYSNNDKVFDLSYDSRKIQSAEKTLFFALKTSHADGHQFIENAYYKGVRNFVVMQQVDVAWLKIHSMHCKTCLLFIVHSFLFQL